MKSEVGGPPLGKKKFAQKQNGGQKRFFLNFDNTYAGLIKKIFFLTEKHREKNIEKFLK